MRKLLLLLVLLVGLVAGPAAAASDPPFPVGACARLTVVDPRPVCVMVDPAE